jgi:hypothetical protein
MTTKTAKTTAIRSEVAPVCRYVNLIDSAVVEMDCTLAALFGTVLIHFFVASGSRAA